MDVAGSAFGGFCVERKPSWLLCMSKHVTTRLTDDFRLPKSPSGGALIPPTSSLRLLTQQHSWQIKRGSVTAGVERIAPNNSPISSFSAPKQAFNLHHVTLSITTLQPPLSPNSFAQSSYSCKPCLLTLGLMLTRLASKSPKLMGLISSVDINSKASPRLRKGPIAASLAKAVMSLPEKPEMTLVLNTR